MTKHISVPEELLEITANCVQHLMAYVDPEEVAWVERRLRALLGGPRVEPVAYRGTAFPGSKDFTYDESEQVLRDFGCIEIDPLYLAAPSAPAQAVPDWQPIETAPRTGEHIVAMTAAGVGFGTCGGKKQQWANVVHWFDDGFYGSVYCGTQSEPYGNLTHWMPLPAAPQPDKENGDVC